MPTALELSLHLPRPALVVQESARCAVTLRNLGDAPVTVANAGLHPEWPTLVVRGPGQGEERAFAPEDFWRRPPIPEAPGEGPERVLAPGEERREVFALLDRASLPRAGTYELEAVERVGPDRITSAPAALEVRPLRPRAAPAPVDEPGQWAMAWVQDDDPPALHVRVLRAIRGEVRPFTAFRVAAPVDPDARPALTAAPPGVPAAARLVAWLEGGDLRFADAGAEPTAPPGEVDLVAGARLLGPLAALDPERPRALALAMFRRALLSAWVGEAPGRGASVEVPFEAPAWSDVLTGDDGRAWVAALDTGAGAPRGHLLAWGEEGPGERLDLGPFKGALAAAGAVALPGGRLAGAVLTWFARREGDDALPLLTRWRLEPGLGVRVEAPVLWPWDRRWQVTDPRLRLDPAGAPYLLVREAGLGWLRAAPLQPPAPCPAAVRGADHPPDLVFAPGLGPVLLAVDPEVGLVGHPFDAGPERD
ncbi:MAG: hypothetical protein M9894_03045 [Planctomycetes bacterium]|nr:hypothetical protein [Planctomycetota bacterium]